MLVSIDEFIQIAESQQKTDTEFLYPFDVFPNSFEKLIEYILNTGKTNIVFDWNSESFSPNVLQFFSNIMKELIENHKFVASNFKILLGVADITINYELYNQCNVEYLPTPIFTGMWENNMRHANFTREISHNVSYSKKFLFLNRQPKVHRLALLSEIIDRNLYDDCLLSFYADDLTKFNCDEYSLILPNIKNKIDNNINSIKHLFPIKLTLKNNEENLFGLGEEDLTLYENTLFSLVGESAFYNNMSLITKYKNLLDSVWCYPCVYPTEKTYRTIRAKHPFIIASIPNFLKGLRELGYKTFSPYINESYDDIENEELRLLAIMDEVERLCNMNPKEIQKWLNSIQQITQYNYERLMNSAG